MANSVRLLPLIFAAALVAAAGAQETRPAAPDDARALAAKVFAFAGGAAGWSQTENVLFTFAGRRRVLWDVRAGKARVENLPRSGGAGTPADVAVYDCAADRDLILWGRADADADKASAKSVWINDTYWLLVTTKVLDPGVTQRIDPARPDDPAGIARLGLSFEKVGLTPENQYVLHVERDTGKVTRWDFYPTAEAEPISWNFEGYAQVGPLMLSLSRPMVGPKSAIEMTDVSANVVLPEDIWTRRDPVLGTLRSAPTSEQPATAPATRPAATAPVAREQRSLSVIPITGDPNGLWWDVPSSTLFIADAGRNRILGWRAGKTPAVFQVAELARPAGRGSGLGQVARLPGGRLLVARYGAGGLGALLVISPAGKSEPIPGLEPTRERLGLAIGEDGTIYSTYFVRDGDSMLGGVTGLDLAGNETEVLGGLQRPVGILAIGDNLYVSEKQAGRILKIALSDPANPIEFARIEAPDLLAAGPAGSLFAGSGGSVYQMASDGKVELLRDGLRQVRGLAFDPKGRRLFVADRDPKEERPAHVIHVVAVR